MEQFAESELLTTTFPFSIVLAVELYHKVLVAFSFELFHCEGQWVSYFTSISWSITAKP